MVLWLGEEGVMCNLYRNVGDVFRGMTSSIGWGGGGRGGGGGGSHKLKWVGGEGGHI